MEETSVLLRIENAEALTRIFGEWPSFHDAEILSLSLDRDGEDGPSLNLKIHLWYMTSEVGACGYHVLRNSTLAILQFGKIGISSINGFNQQNVLYELEIKQIDSMLKSNGGCHYEVFMPTSHGCEAAFQCETIRVVSAEPYPDPS